MRFFVGRNATKQPRSIADLLKDDGKSDLMSASSEKFYQVTNLSESLADMKVENLLLYDTKSCSPLSKGSILDTLGWTSLAGKKLKTLRDTLAAIECENLESVGLFVKTTSHNRKIGVHGYFLLRLSEDELKASSSKKVGKAVKRNREDDEDEAQEEEEPTTAKQSESARRNKKSAATQSSTLNPVFKGPGQRLDMTKLDGQRMIKFDGGSAISDFVPVVDCEKGPLPTANTSTTGGGKKKDKTMKFPKAGYYLDKEFTEEFNRAEGGALFDVLRDAVRRCGYWKPVKRKGGTWRPGKSVPFLNKDGKEKMCLSSTGDDGYSIDAFLNEESGTGFDDEKKYGGAKAYPLLRTEAFTQDKKGNIQNDGSFMEVWGSDFRIDFDDRTKVRCDEYLVVAQFGPYPFAIMLQGSHPSVLTPWFEFGNSDGSTSWPLPMMEMLFSYYAQIKFNPLDAITVGEVFVNEPIN